MLSRSPFYPSLFSPFDDPLAVFDADLIAHRRHQLALARARQIEAEQRRRYEEAVYRAALIRQAYEDEARRRQAAYLAHEQRRREIERALRPATWHIVVEYREPTRPESTSVEAANNNADSSIVDSSTTASSIADKASVRSVEAAQPTPSNVATSEASNEASTSAAPSRAAQRDILDLMNAFVADFDKHLTTFVPDAETPGSGETKLPSDAHSAKEEPNSVADKPQDDVRDAFTSLFKTVDAIMAEGDKVFRRVHHELNKRIEAEHKKTEASSQQIEGAFFRSAARPLCGERLTASFLAGADNAQITASPSKVGSAAPAASPAAGSESGETVNARVDEVIRQAKDLGEKVEKLEAQERKSATKKQETTQAKTAEKDVVA